MGVGFGCGCGCHSTFGRCHSKKFDLLPDFFATSTETSTTNLIGAGEVTVLTLDVSPPLDCFGSSTGLHQVKLDSTVELILTPLLGATSVQYDILYRLRRSDLVSPLATLQINGRQTSATAIGTVSEIPNLTWNNLINTPVRYTVTIQVTNTSGLQSVVAQTRALNAIVFDRDHKRSGCGC